MNIRIDSVNSAMAGLTPLHHAVLCEKDNHNKIKTLLDQGASPAARTRLGDTPLHLTLISKKYNLERGSLYEYFQSKGKGVPHVDDRLFLLEENPFGSDGFSHCHIACLFGKLEIVRSYLDRGVDPDRHRILEPFRIEQEWLDYIWHGDTCLHVATYAGHSDVVQLLLERGADPNARNAFLHTPMHWGVRDHREGSIMKLLVEHGADVNSRDSNGATPLHLQFVHPLLYLRFDMVKTLLEAGADINLIHHFDTIALPDFRLSKPVIYQVSLWMIHHAIKLQEAGFELSDKNLSFLLTVEQINSNDPHRNNCKEELTRMGNVCLDGRTTLRDVLHIHDPRRLQRLAVNEKFGCIIADEEEAFVDCLKQFPIYGGLTWLQYRRGATITEAVLALQKLYYAYMAKGDNGLPVECAEMIVYYLTCEEQWRVIRAASL